MKKTKLVSACLCVVLSLMMTVGCSSSNNPADQNNKNVDDVNDNSISEDLNDAGNEIKDDIKDTTDDIKDDFSDSAADNNKHNSEK